MSLNAKQIFALLQPYITSAPALAVSDHSSAIQPPELSPNLPQVALCPRDWLQICEQLAAYLGLLLKWNARMNLTAIREPEEIVRRHFGQSQYAGHYLKQLE